MTKRLTRLKLLVSRIRVSHS
uniref:Uncharacterized protein n=1 Tax=Anguilla anguilla TaxID=7936 RepID=A0A0E9SK87_ANGAN